MRDLDNRPSRRVAMAALTGAAAITAVSPSPVALAVARTADKALLDLGLKYEAALQIEDEACCAWSVTCDEYEAAQPEMPDVLRHRLNDHWDFQFPISPSTRWISDDTTSSFYTAAEVAQLRVHPQTKRVGYIVELATGIQTPASVNTPYQEGTHEKHIRNVPDPGAQARADEVVAAWDCHEAACQALAASMGCDIAEDAYYDAVRARLAIGDAIAATPATTLAGLRVRAMIVAGTYEDNDLEPDDEHTLEEKMMWATIRDLVQVTS